MDGVRLLCDEATPGTFQTHSGRGPEHLSKKDQPAQGVKTL